MTARICSEVAPRVTMAEHHRPEETGRSHRLRTLEPQGHDHPDRLVWAVIDVMARSAGPNTMLNPHHPLPEW